MRSVLAVLAFSFTGFLSAQTPGACLTDPVGDTLSGATDPKFDLNQVCISVTQTSVHVELRLAPTYGGPDNLRKLGGFVDFDLDRDTATGRESDIDDFGGSPPCPMGVDYWLEFTKPGKVELFQYDEEEWSILVGEYDVVYGTDSVSIALPRVSQPGEAGLPVAGAFLYCVIIGYGGPSDRVPNDSVAPQFAYSGDFDADGDVDLTDFGHFQACFNGPNRPPAASDCGDTDFDGDNDVDLTDFAVFQSCFNGPNRPPAPACP